MRYMYQVKFNQNGLNTRIKDSLKGVKEQIKYYDVKEVIRNNLSDMTSEVIYENYKWVKHK